MIRRTAVRLGATFTPHGCAWCGGPLFRTVCLATGLHRPQPPVYAIPAEEAPKRRGRPPIILAEVEPPIPKRKSHPRLPFLRVA